jgi:5-methylcytosine-specific restriction endonuclease McrA
LGTRRLDACWAIIDWGAYGDTTENGTGWEIDHTIPVASGGGDSLDNLQPLQWQNNRAKGDSFPSYPTLYCVCRAAQR